MSVVVQVPRKLKKTKLREKKIETRVERKTRRKTTRAKDKLAMMTITRN